MWRIIDFLVYLLFGAKKFERIKKDYDLKGQIKTVSNIVCEYMITSDNEFFKRIGEEETKRPTERGKAVVSSSIYGLLQTCESGHRQSRHSR